VLHLTSLKGLKKRLEKPDSRTPKNAILSMFMRLNRIYT